jgi:hypothetical protein
MQKQFHNIGRTGLMCKSNCMENHKLLNINDLKQVSMSFSTIEWLLPYSLSAQKSKDKALRATHSVATFMLHDHQIGAESVIKGGLTGGVSFW